MKLFKSREEKIKEYEALHGRGGKILEDYVKQMGLKKGLNEHRAAIYPKQEQLIRAQASKYWQKDISTLSDDALREHISHVAAEEAKDRGKGKLGAFGASTSTSHTLAQAQAVAREQGRGALLRDMAGHIYGGSGKESFLNALGLLTADQKINMGRNLGGKLGALGIMSGGAVNAYIAATSEDPIIDTTQAVVANYGIQAGWRAGKAGANVLFGANVGHASRILMGGAGALTAVAGAVALGELAKASIQQDGWLKKAASKSYKQEMYVSDRSSQLALTMRQAGLQKLSSSYLNDRGMLLGNEAAVLRGAS